MDTKQLKIGKEVILVNMDFIHKGYNKVYLAYGNADTLFTKIKIEKITEDEGGNFWINRSVCAKNVFPDVTEAKKFVNNYLKKEILRKSKENLQTALLINYYEQIMLENDKGSNNSDKNKTKIKGE
jgi:hypothetical protein